jgi:acyl carrier protein
MPPASRTNMTTASSQSSALPPEQIYERLRAVVTERLFLTPEQIEALRPDLPIVQGLQLDSLAQVTLLAGIEDEFHIELDMEDRQHITTIGDLVTLIQQRWAAN